MDYAPKTKVGTFSIKRLTRSAVMTPGTAGVNEKPTITVTFTVGTPTGQTKIVNGQTWNEYSCSCTFSPDTLEIAYGDTADIKIKLDNNNSTNGWKIVQFQPKASNPSGGPTTTNADSNGDVNFTDNNTVAGTYYYGLYFESQSNRQYATFDPAIQQDGGGEG